MSTGTIVAIAFLALAAVAIVIALGWVLVSKRMQHRHVKADEIREQAKGEALQVKQREALAEETAAKARAAQADADVKAAQASGLEQQAAAHRNEAKTSRDQLDKQWDRADALDPPSQPPEEAKSAHRE
jgi:uncharacterized protein HemX